MQKALNSPFNKKTVIIALYRFINSKNEFYEDFPQKDRIMTWLKIMK